MTARRALLLAALLHAGCGSDAAGAGACGDGVAAGFEDCDGADLRGASCASLGFNSGTLACRPGCVLDLAACAIVELCGNGRDDDGDGDKDCDDRDCRDAPACATCGDGVRAGDEQCDDGNHAGGDCCDGSCRAEPGCELEPNDGAATATVVALAGGQGARRGVIAPAGDVDLYRVEVPAGSTGTLVAETSAFAAGASCAPDTDTRVEIADGAGHALAADDDSGESLCSRARAAGVAPGVALVRVSASPFAPASVFGYTLALALALAPCGDRIVQEGQECDDGNLTPGDGCSAGCRLEDRPEVEPDDDPARAGGPFTTPFAVSGEVGAPGASGFDPDWYAAELPAAARLRIETFVLDATDCAALLAAPALYSSGGVLLAEAALGGLSPTSCGRIVTGPLAAGRYHVLVEARPAPARYRLVVTAETP